MILGSTSSAGMERALSALWERAQLINHNIANEDTPGYKAKKLAFEGMLQNELRSLQNSRLTGKGDAARRIAKVPSVVYEDGTLSVRADGNNVNIDNEHIELARVQLQYQALSYKINGHYTNLKYAIKGGR